MRVSRHLLLACGRRITEWSGVFASAVYAWHLSVALATYVHAHCILHTRIWESMVMSHFTDPWPIVASRVALAVQVPVLGLLKGLSPLLTPDLLWALRAAGHGEIGWKPRGTAHSSTPIWACTMFMVLQCCVHCAY